MPWPSALLQSQRDGGLQPRVARDKLPWEIGVEKVSTGTMPSKSDWPHAKAAKGAKATIFGLAERIHRKVAADGAQNREFRLGLRGLRGLGVRF